MNKTEFVAAIAEEAGISKTDAAKAVKAFTDVVVEEMKKGEKIQLVGFGTFSIKMRKARNVLNPSTGENMVIPARKVVKFTPGYKMKLTDKE